MKIHCRHSLVPERANPCSGYFALVSSGVTDQLVSSLHSSAIQAGCSVVHAMSCVFLHILWIFPLFGKGSNLNLALFYLHFRYSYCPISFYRPQSRRLVLNGFTIVPAGLDSTVPVHSEGCWSSVYEKQTRLPAERNHLSIQRYTNSTERYNICKSKYTYL